MPKDPPIRDLNGSRAVRPGSTTTTTEGVVSIVGLPDPTFAVVLSGSKPKRRTYKKRWKTTGERLSPGNTVPIKNFLKKESTLVENPSGKRKIEQICNEETSKKHRVGTKTRDT